MEDLVEKVDSIEKRLSGLVENFKTSFISRHENHRSTHTNKQPSWMTQLFKSLNEISAELGTVKKTLSKRVLSGNGHSQGVAKAGLTIERGPSYAYPTQVQCEPTPPAITESQRESPPLYQNGCDSHSTTADHLEVWGQDPLAETQINEAVRPLRKPMATPNQLARTKTKGATSELNEVPAVNGRKRKATEGEIQPRKLKVAPEISILSEAVCGKEAFHRFRTLVCSWRDRSKPLFEAIKSNKPAVQLVHIIGIGEERSQLTEFLNRFAKVKLADTVDNGKAGRTSADPDSLNELMDDLKWPRTKQNRTRLHDYLKEGRRWKRLCGSFDSLLCFIPPNREDRGTPPRISGRVYYELSPHDIQHLHSLLSFTQHLPLFQMGTTLQMSIWQNIEVPEFKWESEDPLVLGRLTTKELAPFMKEFHLIEKNEWDIVKHEWPKPDCWPWEWPKSPSWVPPSDARCNLCAEGYCSCIISCLPQTRPQISNEPGKGQGIRAVGTTYKAGQILGELLGEFVPLDAFNDGWSIEFRRPDLSDEPIAQIYSKNMGNWVRKVNHSCDPSAEFKVMKISQLWRQMIVAVRDISHGEEITAFCGRDFLRGQGKTCACSVCSR